MTDDLLPLVHCVWKSFVHRFSDEEPLVTIKVSLSMFVVFSRSHLFSCLVGWCLMVLVLHTRCV